MDKYIKNLIKFGISYILIGMIVTMFYHTTVDWYGDLSFWKKQILDNLLTLPILGLYWLKEWR